MNRLSRLSRLSRLNRLNQLCSSALALSLAAGGCTADFFVGPLDGGSSTTQGPDDSGVSSMTSAPASTTADGSSTTQAATTVGPDATTSSATASTTTSGQTSEDTVLSTEGSTTAASTDTEEPADCIPKEAPACEEAFPSCLWNGEACTVNLCNVGGEKACLTETPDCIWEGGGCIPSQCGEEAECSVLEPGPCETAKGCVLIGVMCFTPPCVPCGEVDDILTCNELPNCIYNELREACLPQ